MTHTYDVIINGNEQVSCSSLSVATNFIKDYFKEYRHDGSLYEIYNSNTGDTLDVIPYCNSLIILSNAKRYNKLINISNTKLFRQAVSAMDNYTKSIEMELFDFADYFDEQMKDYLFEIKQRGLEDEFDEYALIF